MNVKRIQHWFLHNLFNSWYNIILTCAATAILLIIIPKILSWCLFNATFVGDGPEACTNSGACWVFIRMRFNQFMYGYYPRDLQWRINLGYLLGLINIIACFTAPTKYKTWSVLFLFFVFPWIALTLFYGGIFGLEEVDTYSWGGLFVTLVVAVASIACSLPIGIILALCRRSSLPIARLVSTLFIELWRGVPLISVLFMASMLIPIFFSPDLHLDRLLRALIGITLFYSAYMAEEIRTGLAAVPNGQYEAADALGFSYFTTMSLIILPQALRSVIPGILNTFIAAFKNTTLVLIIGIFDFLGMIQAANEDPKWLAYGLEGYVFAAFGYWLFCYLMSRYSVYLERKLNVGRRT